MRVTISSGFEHKPFLGFCLLFSFLCFSGRAQPPSPQKTRENLAWFQTKMAAVDRQSNTDSAMRLLKIMLQESIDSKDDWKCNTVLLKIGERYQDRGDFAQALSYTTQALHYCAALSLTEQSNCYEHLGWLYFDAGDYVTASGYFYEGLDAFKKSGDVSMSGVNLYNDLGRVYFRLHQNEKALAYFNQGEALALRNNWQNSASFILINKGDYYTSIHEPDSARKLFERVNEIGRLVSRPDLRALAAKGIGKTFIESGDYEKAVSYLLTATELSVNRYESIWIESSFYLGEAFYHLGRYRQAESILLAAINGSAANNLKDHVIKGYTTLTAVYKATGQYAKALDCMDSISVLKDALVSAENTRAVDLMDIKFQTAEKDKQIALQNSKIARKNMWMLATGSSVVLLLLVSAGVYLNTRNKQRSLEKENKIGILKAAVAGGDNERSRIARELHDGIGGMLSAAMMRFSSMYRDDPAITRTPAYKDVMNILREMGDEIRKTAHNLMPDVLLKQSLPEAVRAYCGNVQRGGTLQIDFQCFGSFDDLSYGHKLNLYRIIQELVKNVIIHAHADRMLVQLLQNENKLIVSVEDNGIGFHVNDIKGGLGLSNIRTRVSSLDGHFTLESKPGKGTTAIIEFELPVAAQPGGSDELINSPAPV